MTRILVVGGYGGFGARLSRRLAVRGYEVLVAGRSLEKAQNFCRDLQGCIPLRFDRQSDCADLPGLKADIVIDAAGPFQDSGYGLAQACIDAGIHYVDLADARGFVSGIGALDGAARAAGVSVIAGASSVPALSGAVVREAMRDMDSADAIDMAITASNRATAGMSVSRAILSYAGRPVSLWRGKRWVTGRGWQQLVRRRLSLKGGRTTGPRWLALADIPDLTLLPARIAGKPRVDFRAGTDFAHQTVGLWLASWFIPLGLASSLEPLAGLAGWTQKLVRRYGSDLSGMQLRLFGRRHDVRMEKVWTLIADGGDGPEIPTLAAVAIVDKIVGGILLPGARDAGNELTLADFEPLFVGLDIEQEWSELQLPQPLYARVMGADFDALPSAVRAMHNILRDGGAHGEAVVQRGRNPLSRFVAAIMRFPKEGQHRLHVHFEEHDGVECWTRDFGGSRFRSELSQSGRYLVERFGPMRFRFLLPADGNGLTMVMQGWSFLGLPMPNWLAPRSLAREWEEDGRFHFDVPIALPLIGQVVHYRGWLEKD